MLREIIVFIPDRPGQLAEFTKTLMEKQINMRAMTVVEMTKSGNLRTIVDKTDECINLLKSNNYSISVTEVIGIDHPDKPGVLYEIADMLGENDINIEYIYSSTILKAEAIIVLKVDKIDKAIEILKSKGIKLIEK